LPFYESRSDPAPDLRGMSYGATTILGVALNMDWLGRDQAWDRYDAYGILHTYLVAQYQYLHTFLGAVTFEYGGAYGGFLFEF
jgi:hypothetical protein